MAMTGEKFVDADGIRTRCFDKGSGETVVLVHGGNFGATTCADAADDWDLNFDTLAGRFRVVAFDRLGQGYTDNPASDDDYTMDAVVRHARATLRALDVESAHLVGHSRGGYVVCRLTVEHPAVVKSCTIVNSNTCAPGIGRNDLVFANMPRPALTAESQRWALERYAHDPRSVTDSWVAALTAIAEQPKYRETVRKMTEDGLQSTRFLPGLLTDKEEMFRVLAARGIQRPVMQVWGSDDPTVSADQALALFRILAGRERRARWQVFSRSGHFPFREHPRRFNEVLASFIAAP